MGAVRRGDRYSNAGDRTVDIWWYSAALGEFERPFLNGAQRPINRKVQDQPCYGRPCRARPRPGETRKRLIASRKAGATKKVRRASTKGSQSSYLKRVTVGGLQSASPDLTAILRQ